MKLPTDNKTFEAQNKYRRHANRQCKRVVEHYRLSIFSTFLLCVFLVWNQLDTHQRQEYVALAGGYAINATMYASNTITHASGSTAQARSFLEGYVSVAQSFLAESRNFWMNSTTFYGLSDSDDATASIEFTRTTAKQMDELWAWADQDGSGLLEKEELVRIAWVTQVGSDTDLRADEKAQEDLIKTFVREHEDFDKKGAMDRKMFEFQYEMEGPYNLRHDFEVVFHERVPEQIRERIMRLNEEAEALRIALDDLHEETEHSPPARMMAGHGR